MTRKKHVLVHRTELVRDFLFSSLVTAHDVIGKLLLLVLLLPREQCHIGFYSSRALPRDVYAPLSVPKQQLLGGIQHIQHQRRWRRKGKEKWWFIQYCNFNFGPFFLSPDRHLLIKLFSFPILILWPPQHGRQHLFSW